MMSYIENLIQEGEEIEKGINIYGAAEYVYGAISSSKMSPSAMAYLKWTKKCIIQLNQMNFTDSAVEFRRFANSNFKYKIVQNHHQMMAILTAAKEMVGYSQKSKENGIETVKKTPMVFISHSSKDMELAKALVKLLEFIGLRSEHIFCSSVSGYGLKFGEDIFKEIRQRYIDHDLIMIYLVSRHYLESPMSLNEMGAAWMMQFKDFLFVLKDLKLNDIKNACVGKTKIAAIWDNDEVNEKLNDLRDYMVSTFSLKRPNDNAWEANRDEFIKLFKSFQVDMNESDNQEIGQASTTVPKAKIVAESYKKEGKWRIKLTNVGQENAENLKVNFNEEKCMILGKEKFPLEFLKPKHCVEVSLTAFLGFPDKLTAEITWTENGGKFNDKEIITF